MKVEYTGLDTYLHTFELNDIDNYKMMKAILSDIGTITEIFINNKLAFELKVNNIIALI